MDRRKICPICENHIPEDVSDFCFYCGFDLTKRNDKKVLFKMKRAFKGENTTFRFWPILGDQNGPKPIYDILIGLLHGIIFFILILTACSPADLGSPPFVFFSCLAVGFMIGIIIYLLDILIFDTSHNF